MFLAITANNPGDVFMAAPVLIAAVLYYDMRIVKIICGMIGAVIVLRMINLASQKAINTAQFSIVFVLAMIMTAAMLVVKWVKRFDHDSYYTMQDEKKLQEIMMQDILSTADKVSEETTQVTQLVSKLQNSTNIVYNSLHEIATGTQVTAENIQQQTVMTQQIQDAIGATQELSRDMVDLAENSGRTVEESTGVMKQVREQAEQINVRNVSVSDSMGQLQEKMKEVQNIADIIFSISSQTNLLALNASIESARAGEAGRGFAVVAEQIRQLSEQTRTSTANIAKIIGELVENARAAAEAVAESVKATEEQNKCIDMASASFTKINSNITLLTRNVEEVDDKITGLARANDTIVENISQLSATSEQITASTQAAANISEQNSREADNATKLLGEVMETVKSLDHYTRES
ncbi:MAG: chemotaxis protein, partial [Lachnospiraceae bacterium]|nr:chemotaxis protein [Lachnospiraceae bacterium]